MPRSARSKSKTGIYHIILRGINKQIIFEEREDCVHFLQTLQKYKETSGYQIYAYCLMGNHVHLLIKEGAESLGVTMRRIGASYVYWYNWKYDRVGHLFQDRYKSEVVEDERYLLTALRYIHQNPLKAGIADKLEGYEWSSYTEYTNLEGNIVNIDYIFRVFDRERLKALGRFERFHQKISEQDCLDVDEAYRMKDIDAIKIIKDICGVMHCTDIQKLDREVRNTFLKKLKEEGISTRQLSRLTGISRRIVINAK